MTSTDCFILDFTNEIYQISDSQERASITPFHYVHIPPLLPRPGFCYAVCICKVNKNIADTQKSGYSNEPYSYIICKYYRNLNKL